MGVAQGQPKAAGYGQTVIKVKWIKITEVNIENTGWIKRVFFKGQECNTNLNRYGYFVLNDDAAVLFAYEALKAFHANSDFAYSFSDDYDIYYETNDSYYITGFPIAVPAEGHRAHKRVNVPQLRPQPAPVQ